MRNCACNHSLICFEEETCPLCVLRAATARQLEQWEDELAGLQEELQEKRAVVLDLDQRNASLTEELVRLKGNDTDPITRDPDFYPNFELED